MIRKTQNDVTWLEFEQLADIKGLVHGVMTRQGVCECTDSGNVQVHMQAIKRAFGQEDCAMGKQCHGTHVEEVARAKGLVTVEACDGLMTSSEGVMLLTRHADCQAVLFYDPICKAVANAHAGWRGSARGILPKAVKQMEKVYGSKPENLLVCISPSLGPKWAEFRNFEQELPEGFYRFQTRPTYFDFWEISRWQLKEAGVLDHHIEIAKLCTYDNPQDFFSFRRDGVTGRHISSIGFAKIKP
ncbi:MAG: peptidoglycan editing factor PgeF [Chlamydiia bacterium]|nr:peptidoglycan editing factor PgeF [Chlamydiia bacterium]